LVKLTNEFAAFVGSDGTIAKSIVVQVRWQSHERPDLMAGAGYLTSARKGSEEKILKK
jgi:hypothetical protein